MTVTPGEHITPFRKALVERLPPCWKYRILQPVIRFEIPYRLRLRMPAGQQSVSVYDRDGVTPLATAFPRAVEGYAGYCYDGPSGPAWDSITWLEGALVHDILCQLIDMRRLPAENQPKADSLMWLTNLDNGMRWFRAWYSYHGVRVYRRRKVGF